MHFRNNVRSKVLRAVCRSSAGLSTAIVCWTAATFATQARASATDAHWLSPSFGQWSDATQWSTNPFAPNNGNPAGSSYNAFVDASGSSYTVNVGSNVVISSLTVNSPDAHVLDNANIEIDGSLSILNGLFQVGGTLSNATVTATGNSVLQAFSGSTLNNVTVGGNSAGGASVVVDGTTPISVSGALNFANGTVSIKSDSLTTLWMLPGSSLTGNGQIVFDGTGVFRGRDSHLTISSGITVRTGVSTATYANVMRPVVGDSSHVWDSTNVGLVSAETPGLLLTIAGANVNNQGTLQAINNGWLTISGNLVNTGTIIENGSTLNLAISNFTPAILTQIQRTGGDVNLAATYDNTGKTLSLTPSTGSLGIIDGGKITGGTISASGGANLIVADSLINASPSATLDTVTLAANLVVREQGVLNVLNSLTLQNTTISLGSPDHPSPVFGGDGTLIQFGPNAVLGGTGTVLFETTAAGDHMTPGEGASLTIGPNITIRSDTAGGKIGQLVYTNINQPPQPTPITNQGQIISNKSGATITITGSSVSNKGTIQASGGGALSLENVDNTGQISSRGAKLVMLGTITNEGTISTDSGASLSPDFPATDSFSQSSAGTLDFILGSGTSTKTPVFSITGNAPANLAGELSIEFAPGFSPHPITSWTLISAGSIVGTFDSVNLPTLPPGQTFQLDYSPTTVQLTVVPEPATLSLLGVCAIGLLRRPRSRY